MSYVGYVIGAYAVFVAVLLWDLLSPLLRIRGLLREVRLRARRDAARTSTPAPELHR